MHEILEWTHNQAKRSGKIPSPASTHKKFAQRLQAKHLSEHDYKLYLDRGTEALYAYLKQRAHTIGPDNVVEYNFRGEGVFAGQAHLGGKIDKLIVNKPAKEITIVDYKTGRSHSRWSHDVTLHKNRLQLYLYRALVEGSHSFAGYKVTDAYLEFVEPAENGSIQELHLNFDESEYRRVKLLAQAVWQRIMHLDFPKTDALAQDLAGIEAFEADLIERLKGS